jgi:hypothetical protein
MGARAQGGEERRSELRRTATPGVLLASSGAPFGLASHGHRAVMHSLFNDAHTNAIDDEFELSGSMVRSRAFAQSPQFVDAPARAILRRSASKSASRQMSLCFP